MQRHRGNGGHHVFGQPRDALGRNELVQLLLGLFRDVLFGHDHVVVVVVVVLLLLRNVGDVGILVRQRRGRADRQRGR
jgi:hypothetical protein